MSDGRPRRHPEIRPRITPAHMVTAVAPPIRSSVVVSRGVMTVITGVPDR